MSEGMMIGGMVLYALHFVSDAALEGYTEAAIECVDTPNHVAHRVVWWKTLNNLILMFSTGLIVGGVLQC